jgi:hypothetical protein
MSRAGEDDTTIHGHTTSHGRVDTTTLLSGTPERGTMSEEGSDGDPWEVLVEELCARRPYFLGLFAFSTVFLLLQVPYLFVADPDSTLYVLATLNVLGTTVFTLGFGSILWLCARRTI